ncbi:MAG: DUF192 domain-containing protein [Acidimicrobiia bacterium]|nr:DUF192 domain-containing protein [Acidimicrobiia bacterium]
MDIDIDLEKYKIMINNQSLWAKTRKDRRNGLSRIDVSKSPKALYFDKCRSVHTFGMRFNLKIVFFNKNQDVIASKVIKPNRLVLSPKGTYSILEIPTK